MSKKAGVIGYPVSHSLSPRLHNYWLKKYGVEASYDAFPLEPENPEHFLRMMAEKDFIGVNLTIPHKEAAMKWVDEVDDTAKRIGAINTILVQDGKLRGTNTDAYGFICNLKNGGWKAAGRKALVLGAGGAARAVCVGLLDSGYDIILANRTRARADEMAESLHRSRIKVVEWNMAESAMHEIALLVNTTSLGMKGKGALDISLDTLPSHAFVSDIVYNPLMTPLLLRAAERGNKTIDGLGMLLYQAQLAFYEWFGITPEVTSELREYVLQGIA